MDKLIINCNCCVGNTSGKTGAGDPILVCCVLGEEVESPSKTGSERDHQCTDGAVGWLWHWSRGTKSGVEQSGHHGMSESRSASGEAQPIED